MEDILSALDDVTVGKASTKTESKVKSAPRETAIKMGRIDYKNLKEVLKSKNLYAVKNVGKTDLVCDWDLNLMPEELKPEFDSYLSDRYNVYQIKEANLDFRIVVLYREGRSINFMHQFMTEKKIPNLETVREGREVLVKSQFVLPVGKTAIVTEDQYESLKRYEKRRQTSDAGVSDWFGDLVFKQITDPDKLEKVEYSFVTVADIKNNEFETQEHELGSVKKSATIEYSDELDEL